MEPLGAAEVARLLEEIGQRIELEGDSPFKARAYDRAAKVLRTLPEPLADLVAKDRVREIPGVGDAIEEKIVTLHRTGSHRTLERLRERVPDSVLGMLAIPRLGADKVSALFNRQGIRSVEELEDAAKAGRLAGVKGFGPKFQEKVLDSIDRMRRYAGLLLADDAYGEAAAACARVARACPGVEEVVAAGAVRRACEVVDSIVVAARVQAGASCDPPPDVEAEVHMSPAESWGAALIFATGSREHVEQLQARAASLRIRLDARGLTRDGAPIACPTEEDVYRALGLPFIPPEMREGAGEIGLAESAAMPDLVTAADVRGMIHCHTNRSDGTRTLEEMAEAARSRGYEYFGVADHSQAAAYAGGLKPEQVRLQFNEVDELNRRYADEGIRFRVFKGIEADILADGSLDYTDDLLAEFDYVVASVHSRFGLAEEEQTARIVKAVSNPRTTILGHPTGRLLLEREPYAVDLKRVLAACGQHGLSVEINANPHRLDLDWRWHRHAVELGCTLCINTDAHSRHEMDHVRWGVGIARKAGIGPQHILCCLPLEEFAAHLKGRRR